RGGGGIASEAWNEVVQPAIGCHWHTPALHVSVVQGFESSQSAAVMHGVQFPAGCEPHTPVPELGIVVDVVGSMLPIVVVVVVEVPSGAAPLLMNPVKPSATSCEPWRSSRLRTTSSAWNSHFQGPYSANCGKVTATVYIPSKALPDTLVPFGREDSCPSVGLKQPTFMNNTPDRSSVRCAVNTTVSACAPVSICVRSAARLTNDGGAVSCCAIVGVV